ncbi:hypothetical protein [Frigoriglobus tundricola]|uniref:PEP-CTERM protein-sorting domain-containing protein n=1 Tax=Frigoriglobus tundricola TaxID=2774151 RepID=A0A6M5YUR7_9BACT|nr:hypothetical protein [Frigoriglobus tundricola]QJW97146.1 hypothetical protein FTUN_4711 [Frigoriglobus tundricola]
MIHRSGLLLIGLVTLATPAPAAAGLIAYADAGAFQAAAAGGGNIDFAGMVQSHQYVSYPASGGLSVGGVTFSIANPVAGDAVNVTSRNYYPGATYARDFLVNAYVPSANTLTMTITLPTPVTAVGLDLGTFKGGALGFAFSNGATFTQSGTATFGQTAFLGFTSSPPFTSLTITESLSGGEALVIDDLQYGIAAPEPASVALLASGLLAVGCRRLLGRRTTGDAAPRAA